MIFLLILYRMRYLLLREVRSPFGVVTYEAVDDVVSYVTVLCREKDYVLWFVNFTTQRKPGNCGEQT